MSDTTFPKFFTNETGNAFLMMVSNSSGLLVIKEKEETIISTATAEKPILSAQKLYSIYKECTGDQFEYEFMDASIKICEPLDLNTQP